MDEEQTGDHRRDFLKKVAVGGAVAWTAPVVLSSRASAGETGSPPPTSSTDTTVPEVCIGNGDWVCGDHDRDLRRPGAGRHLHLRGRPRGQRHLLGQLPLRRSPCGRVRSQRRLPARVEVRLDVLRNHVRAAVRRHLRGCSTDSREAPDRSRRLRLRRAGGSLAAHSPRTSSCMTKAAASWTSLYSSANRRHPVLTDARRSSDPGP